MEGAITPVGIVWKENFAGGLEIVVVDGAMPISKAYPDADAGRKLVFEFGEIRLFILFEKEAGNGEGKIRRR